MGSTVNVFTGLKEGLSEFPFVTELAMEDYILSNKGVIEAGFGGSLEIKHVNEKVIKLSDGKQGRIDLFAVYKDSPVIIELKNDILEKSHLVQLVKYLDKGKKDDFFPDSKSSDVTWGGILVGTGIKPSLFDDIKNVDGFEVALVQLNRFRTTLDQSLVVSNVVFPFTKLGSRVKYYSFNGSSYSMSMLIWACTKDYVKKHKDVTFNDLSGLVNITTGLKVLEELYKVPLLQKSYRRMYYDKPDQQIVLGETSYVVLGWWGSHELGLIEKIISNLGYKVDLKNLTVCLK